MDDRKMGYPPAANPGEYIADCVDDWPLGVPRRVVEEYEARALARRNEHIAEVTRNMKLNELRVYWVCMTSGDSDGLIARGAVNPQRVKQIAQPKRVGNGRHDELVKQITEQFKRINFRLTP
jgi:hypothetical protein